MPHASAHFLGLSPPLPSCRRSMKKPCTIRSLAGDGGGAGGGRGAARSTAQSGDSGRWNRWQQLGLAVGGGLLLARQAKEVLDAPAWRRDTSQQQVSVIIPALNEEKQIGRCVDNLLRLEPLVHEVIVVDGGSQDRTVELAEAAGATVLRSGRGRAAQMNAGARAAAGAILVFLHADSTPPRNLAAAVRRALADGRTVLGGFRTVIRLRGRRLAFMTAHQFIKTYYMAALLRPLSFVRGAKLLFGDQTLFCRAADFARVGGYNGALPIMEDADLCVRMHMAGPAPDQAPASPVGAQVAGEARPCCAHGDERQKEGGGVALPLPRPLQELVAAARRWARRRGRIIMVFHPAAETSGRRLKAWGNLRATAIHVVIGFSWYFGAKPDQMRALYARLYTDDYR